jgi:sec-independent protein translocase protein TatB
MSFSETVFLFLLALVIFGPKKLPEIARQVGKYLNEFKRASNEFKAQIEQEIAHMDVESKQTILPPSPPPVGATSRGLSPTNPATVENVATPAEPPATLAASTESVAEAVAAEPSATATPATEALPASVPDPVPVASSSQESHA